MTTDTPGKPTQTDDITKLREEVSTLRMLLDDVRQRTSLEHVLGNGLLALNDRLAPLASLNDKLAPLSSLFNRGAALTAAESKALRDIRKSLASPDYSDLEAPLDIVGDVRPPGTMGGYQS
jgi:hypothetical protein